MRSMSWRGGPPSGNADPRRAPASACASQYAWLSRKGHPYGSNNSAHTLWARRCPARGAAQPATTGSAEPHAAWRQEWTPGVDYLTKVQFIRIIFLFTNAFEICNINALEIYEICNLTSLVWNDYGLYWHAVYSYIATSATWERGFPKYR